MKLACKHRLRTPNEAFFPLKSSTLGLARKIGSINSGAFGVYSAKLDVSTYFGTVFVCLFISSRALFIRVVKDLSKMVMFKYESLVHVFHYSTIISTNN